MKTILVVEDNQLFRYCLELSLPQLLPSFKFVFAGSAGSALTEAGKSDTLHCLVTDYRLGTGQLNGIELAQEIRKKFPAIKVILLSSHITDELKQEAERHKIDACVFKLENIDKLIDSLIQ